jgi:hypothetical protein
VTIGMVVTDVMKEKRAGVVGSLVGKLRSSAAVFLQEVLF